MEGLSLLAVLKCMVSFGEDWPQTKHLCERCVHKHRHHSSPCWKSLPSPRNQFGTGRRPPNTDVPQGPRSSDPGRTSSPAGGKPLQDFDDTFSPRSDLAQDAPRIRKMLIFLALGHEAVRAQHARRTPDRARRSRGLSVAEQPREWGATFSESLPQDHRRK